ncbi:GntR family transcriptional regulator [Microterricola viridarii]|uniref:GntR family transcriptional regulator n=1 Tax=Microterricola viridarii TaxID=412690 RepID=A0A0Y0NGG1_9MICO|nr:GntR family transcriptional regulator [Microterricola viridarii]
MSAIDDAFHGLRQMIASGELQPGQQFPSEAQLCDRLQVSRGSLREGVRMLGALGVIESRHGSGTYVSALEPANIIGALGLTVGLMPLEGLIDMFESRRVLESHATAQAAANMTDAVAAELSGILDALELASEQEQASDLDAQFHEKITGLAKNATIAELLRVFRSRSRSYQLFDLPAGPDIKAQSDHSHREILAALIARDPATAATAAASHVLQTERWAREHRPAAKPGPLSAD